MMKWLFIVAGVLCLAVGPAMAADVMVESRAGGKNYEGYKELSGNWEDSNSPPIHAKSQAPDTTKGIGGRKFRLTPGASGSARFSPNFKEKGHYHVYATWPLATSARPVYYLIKHAAGETSKTVTQDGYGTIAPNGNKWIELGDYDFEPGAEQYVELVVPPDADGMQPSHVPQAFADSVLFAEKPREDAISAEPEVELPAKIVVETRKEGQNFANYKEVSGTWTNSGDASGTGKSRVAGASDAGKVGTRKWVFMSVEGNPLTTDTAVAHFSPNLPGRGKYYVYVTWPRAANATDVSWIVKHRGGEAKKNITQDGWGASGRQNGEAWHLLGHFDFDKGPEQYVEVRGEPGMKRPDNRNLGQLYADAVMFSRESLDPPRQTASAGAPGAAPQAAPSAGSAPVTLTWLDEIDAALAAASKSNKKILIFFHSPESEASQHYQRSVFEDQEVKREIAKDYVLGRINFATNASRASQLGVFKAGTVVIYSSKGEPLLKIDGRRTADELVGELKRL